MTFQMIRTSVRPSADIKFYRVTDKLIEYHLKNTGTVITTTPLEAAFLALGDRYLGCTVNETGNTQTVTRSFTDEEAYNEAKLSLIDNPVIEQMRIDRENYNSLNDITTEVVTLTI